MKHIKTYMGICLGSLLMTMSSCEPDMDFNNPSADNEATYYNTKEHLTYAVNGAYNILQRAGGWARWMPFMLNARSMNMCLQVELLPVNQKRQDCLNTT